MNFISSVNFYLRYDTFVDSSREDISSIIISMFTDKINTSGGSEHLSLLSIQDFEFVLNL